MAKKKTKANRSVRRRIPKFSRKVFLSKRERQKRRDRKAKKAKRRKR